MIINKKTTLLVLAVLALFSLAMTVRAESGDSKTRDGREAVTTSVNDDELKVEDVNLDDVNDSIDNLDKSLDNLDDEDANATTSERSRGDEHRSEMSDIMKELSKIADQDSEIGDDIDSVVKEQKDTEDRAVKAMNEVEKRDGLRTFFFGTDYKNLGELKSTVETTQNHIERLQKAVERTTDASVKADLEAQIQALENTASSTEVFIRDNEGKFSLFGWFVRIFQK